MTPKRPVIVQAVLDQADSHALPDPADQARDHSDDFVDAIWLYQWSHTALRPRGAPLAARLAVAG
jgi:hypothetical protein